MTDIKEAVGELPLDRLRALSDALAALQGERRECEIKPRGSQVNVIPLSLAQEGLWFLEQLGLLGSTYNENMVLELEGALDQEALERSFAELVRRHESLRTRIEATSEGLGRQVIDPAGGFRLRVVDLSPWPEAGWPEAGWPEAGRMPRRRGRSI
jgi:Condensation domain